MADDLPLLRPMPQRAFQITPASTEPSTPPTPSNNFEASLPSSLDFKFKGGIIPPSRTRSILNLTSSTLFGIYARTDELNTPWGAGAMTPANPQTPSLLGNDVDESPVAEAFQRTPVPHHMDVRDLVLHLILRTLLLFVLGMAYGVVVTHLHDNPHLVPVKVGGIDRHSWRYLIFWGLSGVVFGSLLPWLDTLWEDKPSSSTVSRKNRRRTLQPQKREDPIEEEPESSALGADWNQIVRSIGAFIGISFAIRKLPWESTLQVSLTLALVNPVLWYLIDRSKTGFLISALVGIMGTAVLVNVNPEMVPSPATLYPPVTTSNGYVESRGIITYQNIGVWTWIASVLFCSCVCFGNIGRRLVFSWPGGGIKVHYNKGV